MEGKGPLHGSPRDLGRIVLADDPVAADFVCARLMDLNPLRVNYLAQAVSSWGTERLNASCTWEKGCHPLCSRSRFCQRLLNCAFRFGCSKFRESLPSSLSSMPGAQRRVGNLGNSENLGPPFVGLRV